MTELARPRAPRRSPTARRRRRTPRPGGAHPRDDLVVTLVTQNADSVLRLTRRLSLCDADAEDAYQRALEILVRNAERLEPSTAASWLLSVGAPIRSWRPTPERFRSGRATHDALEKGRGDSVRTNHPGELPRRVGQGRRWQMWCGAH